MSGMQARYLGYGGLLLILVGLCFLIVSFQEMRFESTVARHKGTVIGKDLEYDRRSTIYRVRYRVTIQSRTLESASDVGSQKTWDSIRVGDEIDVESVGVTPSETRLVIAPKMGSWTHRGIAAACGLAGVVLIVLRFRKERAHG